MPTVYSLIIMNLELFLNSMNCLFWGWIVDISRILEEYTELWSKVRDCLPDSLEDLKGVSMDVFVLITLNYFRSSAYKIGM